MCSTTSLVRRVAAGTIAGGLALGLTANAAAQSGPPTILYTLGGDSSYAQGCFGGPEPWQNCLCPIFLALDFRGTFGLTAAPSGDPDVRRFDVSNVSWTVSLSGEIEITGSGVYEITTTPDGPVQRLTLDLLFDGQGPTPFDSGIVPGGDDGSPPVIDVPISDGLFCPGRRITVGASATAPTPSDVFPMGGDGVVDVADLLCVLSDYGLPAPRATDIDDSGTVDVGDVLAVLGAWTN
ncbi:MAG: hypothetical protein ACYTG1_03760 [Planctomycetota bacterium]|jgi:hypothetical protein